MIKKDNERIIDIKEHLKDGEGNVIFKKIAEPEEMYNRLKMFNTVIIKKGCSIGYHTHHGEQEVMLVKSGKGLYKDDGKEYEINPGDVTICFEEHYHGISNIYDEDLELVALIIENK